MIRSLLTVLIAAGLLSMFLPALTWADASDVQPTASRTDPDYAAGKKAIEAKDWSAAIKSLSAAASHDPTNPDIENYLGFAYRNEGQMDPAFQHYEKALKLDPKHRGAHEYVGEAYLKVGNLAKAEEHLASLRYICGTSCEEYEDLHAAIEAYK